MPEKIIKYTESVLVGAFYIADVAAWTIAVLYVVGFIAAIFWTMT